MYELYPYFTNDGSVGLFSPDADDIYHSTYGALSEAYEKFILPANFKNYFQKNSEIKILDICFGIGYNTKSFLNIFYDFLYNETIGTDNTKYIDKTYTDNKKYEIFIHAIDTDKNLACLSPFFISNKKNIKNDKLPFEHEKIQRMLSGKTHQKFKLRKEIDILLLEKVFNFIDLDAEELLFSKKYCQYFDKYMRGLYGFYKNRRYLSDPLSHFNVFLHNIYYRNLSSCYKNAMKALKTFDFDFRLSIEDARQAVKNDANKYNYIFLDAFSPVKCPCLWTVDFFELLFEHLEDDGMILTYSNSALVRNAFINAGFHVGKIYSQSAKKFTGTVAAKSPLPLGEDSAEQNGLESFCEREILNEPASYKNSGEGYITELSEYDLGLMKTKAGIFFHDENLSLDNAAIIAAHKKEVENSNLISSSKFIKQFNR